MDIYRITIFRLLSLLLYTIWYCMFIVTCVGAFFGGSRNRGQFFGYLSRLLVAKCLKLVTYSIEQKMGVR